MEITANISSNNSVFLLSTSSGQFSPSPYSPCPHSKHSSLAGVAEHHITATLELAGVLPRCRCVYIRVVVRQGDRVFYRVLRLEMMQGNYFIIIGTSLLLLYFRVFPDNQC